MSKRAPANPVDRDANGRFASRKPAFGVVELNASQPPEGLKKSFGGKSKSVSLQAGETLGGMTFGHFKLPPFPLNELDLYYTNSSWHKAAVDAVATAVVSGPIEIKPDPNLPKGFVPDEGQKKILSDFLADCSPEQSLQELVKAAVVDFKNIGFGAIEVGRNSITGKPDSLWYMPSRTLLRNGTHPVVLQRVNEVHRYFWMFGSENSDPEKKYHEVLWVMRPNSRSLFYGIPDHVAAVAAIMGDILARQFNLDKFQSRMIAEWAITFNGKVPPNVRAKIEAFFKEQLKNRKFHVPLLLESSKEGTIKFDRLSEEVKDASWSAYRKLSRDEILAVHRVPPNKIASFEATRFQSSPEQAEQFRDEVVTPIQGMFEFALKKIVRALGVTHWILALPIADISERTQITATAKDMAATQCFTRNEIRKVAGYEPLPPEKGGEDVIGAAPAGGMTGAPGVVASSAAAGTNPIQDIINTLRGQAPAQLNASGQQAPPEGIEALMQSLVSKSVSERLRSLETRIAIAVGRKEQS